MTGMMSLRQNMEEEKKEVQPAGFQQVQPNMYRDPTVPQSLQASDKHGGEDGVLQPGQQEL